MKYNVRQKHSSLLQSYTLHDPKPYLQISTDIKIQSNSYLNQRLKQKIKQKKHRHPRDNICNTLPGLLDMLRSPQPRNQDSPCLDPQFRARDPLRHGPKVGVHWWEVVTTWALQPLACSSPACQGVPPAPTYQLPLKTIAVTSTPKKTSTLGGNRTSLLVHLPENMSSIIRSPYYQGMITHVNQSPITHGRGCILLVQIAYTPCPPNSLVTTVMLPRQFVMDLFYISLVHTIPDPRMSCPLLQLLMIDPNSAPILFRQIRLRIRNKYIEPRTLRRLRDG